MTDVTDNSGPASYRSHPVIPEDATILLPVRNCLLFPGMVLPLTIGRPASIAAAQEAAQSGPKVGLLLQDDASIEQPGPEHLRRGAAREPTQLLPTLPAETPAAIDSLESPSALADFLAGIIDIPVSEKQDLLETFDVTQLLDRLLGLLAKRIQVLQLSKEIGDQTQQTLSSQQREHILREQLRQIQKELGDDDVKSAELKELADKIEIAGMPKEPKEQASREWKRLERMPEASPEYGMTRTYLDWLLELPWSKLDPERIDIAEARCILDEDHYALEKVKRRILEYLAVRKLNPDGKSPILCFIGPPGVGKTSLGQSIARATDRKFVRLSLGGVHDESEIR